MPTRTKYRLILKAIAAWVWCVMVASPATGDVTTNLRGRWLLTETSGTTAADSSTFSNNGAYTGGVSLSSSPVIPLHGVQAATFNGSTGYVTLPNHSHFNVSGSFSVAAWIRVNAFDRTWQTIVAKGDSAWRLSRNNNTNTLHFAWGAYPNVRSVDSTTSVNDGQWHHVVGVYNGSSMRIYIDGALNNSASASGTVTTNSFPVTIGSNAEISGRQWNGSIYDVRFYNRALSADEVIHIATQGKPIGHWKLDETSGTTAADSSGLAQHGTVTGTPVWTPAVLKNGFLFDYTNGDDYITLPNSTYLQNVQAGSYSLSAWFKPLSTPPNSGPNNSYALIMKEGLHLGLFYSNWQGFQFDHWLAGPSSAGVATWGYAYAPGRFYHVVGVVNRPAGTTKIYVDGRLINTHNFTPNAPGRDYGTTPWRLGIGAPDASSLRWAAHGVLDDARVYPRALSDSEIAELYGLLGHWKLTETAGTTAVDSSPMSNDGTYSNVSLNAEGPYPGEGSDAADFNGVGRVTVPNESLYDITETISVAAWIKVDAFDVPWQTIVTKGDSAWRLQREGSTDSLMFGGDGITPLKVVGTKNVNDGKWHHVVGTYDGSQLRLYVDGQLDASVAATGAINTNNVNVWIGDNADKPGRYWNGPMHDVRVYNRALTAVEITELYGLVGHWKLSDTSGTTATDSSLAGNHGTYLGGVTLNTSGPHSNTVAAQFDGVNDRVNVPTSSNFSRGFSIAAWGRPTSAGSWSRFVEFGGGQDVHNFFLSRVGTTNTLEVAIHGGTWGAKTNIRSANALALNAWHHYVATVDSNGEAKLYRDGVELPITSGSAGYPYIGLPRDVPRNSNFIARSNWAVDAHYEGRMHDVRVYNRPLSQEEIDALLVAGSWPGIRIIRWMEVR